MGSPAHGGDSVCALIAVKARAHCKSRLQATLSSSARLSLVRSMLGAVLRAASAAPSVTKVVVLSPERDEVPQRIPLLVDRGESLNAALGEAHALLPQLGCTAALILPADLPHLSAAELEVFVRAGRESGFAIAPDEAGRGTNALFISAAAPFQFCFGADSLQAHLAEASRLALPARHVRLPGLAFDVDVPEDLARLTPSPQEAESWWIRLPA